MSVERNTRRREKNVKPGTMKVSGSYSNLDDFMRGNLGFTLSDVKDAAIKVGQQYAANGGHTKKISDRAVASGGLSNGGSLQDSKGKKVGRATSENAQETRTSNRGGTTKGSLAGRTAVSSGLKGGQNNGGSMQSSSAKKNNSGSSQTSEDRAAKEARIAKNQKRIEYKNSKQNNSVGYQNMMKRKTEAARRKAMEKAFSKK